MAREHYWPTGSKTAQDQEKRALAVEHDRQVRHRSVANDCLLDLPVSIARQDGEEYPARPRLRSHDKRYEIQKPYIQGPPNKTVWDSIDCLERTVTQPSSSSSSSSRSGGNKSASKSSSSHWGLSWSRSNKSPPSQGRTSRGQSRHASSNPSTSVRNPSSSVCETARGKYGGGSGGGGEGLLDGPLLSSFIPSSSSSAPSASSLGTIPHSSPLGFHGAATSLVAGDTVHCAFANHNHHHHHSPNPSASHQHHHPTPTTTSKPPQQESLVFSGVESGAGVDVPSGGGHHHRFSSEKVQQQQGTARTSPNNNSSTSTPSPSTSVLQRLIDPEMKLFSRNSSTCSKESRRSNNNANANNSNHGKNGKSHRTDQSLSAASSSSAMATDKINPSCSGRRGSGRTAITCGGPSSSSSSSSSTTTPGVERMMTTEDAYCYGADTDATDDDGAILFSRCSSSDMKDGDAEGCLTVDGQGVIGRDTNTTLKLSPQQPPFMLSSPSALSFNNSQHVRMSSSVPSASPMFNCNNFNSEAAAGAGAAAVAPDSSSCLVSERKRNLHEHFTSSGYRTDPNYSTFVSNKMMIGSSCRNNNSPQTPPPSCSGNSASCSDCSSSSAGRSVQSQYGLVVVGTSAAPETNKECLSTMDTGDSANNKATVGKETAHHCELSETFIASNKNDNCTDPDQYCTAAELTISSSSPLQTRNNNEERGTPTSSSESSPFSQSSSSSSALSLGQPDNRHSSPASP